MAKSAPSSPDPSAAWPGGRTQGKQGKREQNKLGIPQVKCLQRLPQMSPKLKKMFHRKNKSHNGGNKRGSSVSDSQEDHSGVSCENSEDELDKKKTQAHEGNKATPKAHLDIIQEKEDGANRNVSQDVGAKQLTLANVVLNILKNKRNGEYAAVEGTGEDTEDDFENIKIRNIGEVVSGTCPTASTTSTGSGEHSISHKDGKQCPQANNNPPIHFVGKRDMGSGCSSERKSDRKAFSTSSSLLSPPKIVLTKDTNNSSR